MNTLQRSPEETLRELRSAHERVDALEAEVVALHRRLEDAVVLNRIIAATAAMLDPSQAFEVTCAELARAYGVPQAALAVLNPTRTVLNVVAEYCERGRVSGLGEQIAVVGNPIMDDILTRRAPFVINDAQHDPRLPASVRDLFVRRRTRSALIMPVIIQHEVVGTLGVDAVEQRVFSADELELAQRVSQAISQALYNTQLYAAVQQELAERKRAEAVISAQAATLAQLSTPLIPLSQHVLVLPLIGAVDAARSQQIAETLLAGVVERRAKAVIIDITGLCLVDAQIMSGLTRIARAVQLLGATTIITGVRAEIAQTLVGLGINLDGIFTFGTLQRGIEFATQSFTRTAQ